MAGGESDARRWAASGLLSNRWHTPLPSDPTALSELLRASVSPKPPQEDAGTRGGGGSPRVPLGSSLAQDPSRLAELVSITTFCYKTYFDKNKVKAARLCRSTNLLLALPLPTPHGGGIRPGSFPFPRAGISSFPKGRVFFLSQGQGFLPSLAFATEDKMESLVYWISLCAGSHSA